jgi:hypothetical protein
MKSRDHWSRDVSAADMERSDYNAAMTRFGTDYQVARSTGVCSATSQPLVPGSACIATLCERPGDEAFDRKDFSIEAWEAGARPEGLYSYWKTIVPAPDAKPRLLVDDTVLMDLFERLASDERPQRIAFRYVLGLILMRKKLLKFSGRQAQNAGSNERWLLQTRGENSQTYEVVNPNLSDDDVRDLIDQLSEVLQSEL